MLEALCHTTYRDTPINTLHLIPHPIFSCSTILCLRRSAIQPIEKHPSIHYTSYHIHHLLLLHNLMLEALCHTTYRDTRTHQYITPHTTSTIFSCSTILCLRRSAIQTIETHPSIHYTTYHIHHLLLLYDLMLEALCHTTYRDTPINTLHLIPHPPSSPAPQSYA